MPVPWTQLKRFRKTLPVPFPASFLFTAFCGNVLYEYLVKSQESPFRWPACTRWSGVLSVSSPDRQHLLENSSHCPIAFLSSLFQKWFSNAIILHSLVTSLWPAGLSSPALASGALFVTFLNYVWIFTFTGWEGKVHKVVGKLIYVGWCDSWLQKCWVFSRLDILLWQFCCIPMHVTAKLFPEGLLQQASLIKKRHSSWNNIGEDMIMTTELEDYFFLCSRGKRVLFEVGELNIVISKERSWM